MQKLINSALNSEASSLLTSDYRIVLAWKHLSLQKNKKQTVKTTRYD